MEILQRVESEFDALPFDVEGARTLGRVTAAVVAVGRKPRRRVADLMIASTAILAGLPLYTTNPKDYIRLDEHGRTPVRSPEFLELTSTMGASKWKTFCKVRFPASLPQLMSGLKIAATLAVTGAVVGEFVGANEGLGYVILQANGNIDTAKLFAALIIMSLLGILLFLVIEIAEKFLLPWHASRRSTASVGAV